MGPRATARRCVYKVLGSANPADLCTKHLPRTAIVALTANTTATDRALCQEVGMDGLIAKPFQLEDLADTLDLYLTRKSETKVANG